MILIVPVVVILIAENLGHIKAVNVMTHRNLDPYIGRSFFGDGLATILAGFVGGPGVTTYGENIGGCNPCVLHINLPSCRLLCYFA